MQELNQVLANTAVTGLFQGQIDDANCILNYLGKETVDPESLACLRGLALFSQGQFAEAISSVEEWTQNKPPSTTHSLLAMFCWKSGKTAQAEFYCNQILKHTNDNSAAQLANDILLQLRSHS